jgi:hypothetical protein
MITVSTVRDRAAAEVAKEALTAINIPVEIRLLGKNPYFGSITAEEWEIRVPEEHEDDALEELDRIGAELEQAVFAEAGVPAPEGVSGEDDDLHADEEQPKKLSWALALSLILPFPGGGCMYARANALGLTIFGVWLGLVVGAILGAHFPYGMQLWIGAKILDLILSPFCVMRFNRRLADAARS